MKHYWNMIRLQPFVLIYSFWGVYIKENCCIPCSLSLHGEQECFAKSTRVLNLFFCLRVFTLLTRIFCVSMMKYKYMLIAFSWKLSSGGARERDHSGRQQKRCIQFICKYKSDAFASLRSDLTYLVDSHKLRSTSALFWIGLRECLPVANFLPHSKECLRV